MAAFLVVTINCPNATITNLKDEVYRNTKGTEQTVAVRNFLDKILGGCAAADVTVTVRDTDPSVTTSGTGSVQQTHGHK